MVVSLLVMKWSSAHCTLQVEEGKYTLLGGDGQVMKALTEGGEYILSDRCTVYFTCQVCMYMGSRLLKIRHLYGIWSGLIPYRLRLDTLSEYPEP